MHTFDLLIRGGTIVNAGGQATADIGVSGESIAAVAPALPGPARQVIDASGCYVFPGFIDPHVHLSLPIGRGLVSSDDFRSGTQAAACGGVTTIIDFTDQPRGASLVDAVASRRQQADGNVAIDYSLHLTVMDDDSYTLGQLGRLAADGFPSLKLYMTYEGLMVRDAAMLRIMAAAGECGSLVLVHAENHDIVAHLTEKLLQQGKTGPGSHPRSRPPWVEGEAAGRAIALARAAGADLYIVHVSCAEALAPIVEARQSGQTVYGETCPHYLLLDDAEYDRPGFDGARYVMTPPLRPSSNWPLLWNALAGGTLDVVATDHCPWNFATQKTAGRDYFDLIPGGVAGVESRGVLMYSEGVARGRLTLERFADVMSTRPARIFGLYPRKGSLAVGSDADITILDPRRRWTLHNRDLHSQVDYNVFEGWKIQGSIAATISRGTVVAKDGQITGGADHGRFVPRWR